MHKNKPAKKRMSCVSALIVAFLFLTTISVIPLGVEGIVPGAPQNLQATAGDSYVDLVWDPPPNDGNPITNYTIYRDTSHQPKVPFVILGNVTAYNDTDVINGQTYYYKVSANNSEGEGALTAEVQATPMSIPSAPQNLQAASGIDEIDLAWSAPLDDGGSTITDYYIYRGTIPGGEVYFAAVGNQLSYTDNLVTRGATYYYVVSAKNDVGVGPQSNEANATVPDLPSAPQNLVAVPGNHQVTLNWDAPISDGGSPIINYNIYRGLVSEGESYFTDVGSQYSYIDPGLTNGQTYFYKVSAVNAVGEGPLSNEDSAAPGATPSATQNLQASPGNAQVVLTWTAPTDNGGYSITNYTIYRGTTSGGEAFFLLLGNVTTHTDASLTNGVTYYYQVSAMNIVGEGPLSSEVSAKPVTTPSAPQNLQAVSGAGQVALTWSAPSNDGGSSVTNYSIYRGMIASGEVFLTTVGNQLSYTDSLVTAGLTYYYKVSANNSEGEGPLSNEASATVPTVPSAPQELEAFAGDGQILLRWSAPAGNGGSPITNYRIYRGTVSGGESYLTVIGNELSYTDKSLTNGVTYFYRVSAVNDVGEGPPSSEVNATPRPGSMVPSPPLNLQAIPGNAQVTLTWSIPGDDGGSPVTNYTIYRGIASGAQTKLVTIGNVLQYLDTGLTNGQTYYYKVSAINAVGEGPLSSEYAATPALVPSAPQNVMTDPSDIREITLSWSPPVSDGGIALLGYMIYRGVSPSAEILIATIGPGNVTFIDYGLSDGTVYYYQISAFNAIGEGAKSSEAMAETWGPPGPPQGLTASPGDSNATLTWSVPVDDGGSEVTGYRIYRGTSSGGETFLKTLAGTFYVDTGLANGLTYYYVVSALNAVGEGLKSDEVSATPAAGNTVPSPPRNVQAMAGDGQVVLTWLAPASNGGLAVTNYTIYRGTLSNGESYLVTVGDQFSYTDTGLTNGQTYFYKVSAVNAIGEGQLSNEANATPTRDNTVPSAVQNLQVSAGDSNVTLTWSAPTDDGGSPITGYKIYRGIAPEEVVYLTTITATSYFDTNVTNGQTYYYKVCAVNAIGDGVLSSEVIAGPGGEEDEFSPLLIIAVVILNSIVIIFVAYEWTRGRRKR